MRGLQSIGRTFVREVGRMGSRPLYCLTAFILPLTAFFLFSAIFSHGVPRELPLAVCDSDHSALSRKLTRMLDSSASLRVAEQVADLETGRRMIREGKVYAVVFMKKGLEQEALEGRAPSVINYYNNEFLLPGSLVNRDVRAAVTAASDEIARSARLRRIGVAPSPPAQPVRVQAHQLFNPELNYTYFLVAALLPTMLQIFILVTTVYALGVELKEGTAGEWLETAGTSAWRAVVGKMLPYTLIFAAMGYFMVFFLFDWLGTPLRGSPACIAVGTFLFVAAYQAASLLIVSVTANLRLSLNVAAFYATTAFTFVGITFPSIGMPSLARWWAGIIPLYYYLKILIDQGLRGIPARFDSVPLLVLAAFACVIPLLTLHRMGTVMAGQRYWGRQ